MFLDPVRPKSPPTFGTADFMDVKEAFLLRLHERGERRWLCPYVGGLVASQNDADPVLELYARSASALRVRRSADTGHLREGSGHLITIAPTRAGKGVGQIIPNLLTWDGSCVVLDVKGENYLSSAGYRSQELKQHVVRFAPFEDEKQIWNPIMSVSTSSRKEEEEDARYLVNLLVTPSGSSSDKFWENSARNFLEGLVLHVRVAPLVPGHAPERPAGALNDEQKKRFIAEQAIFAGQVQERSMREVRRLLSLNDAAFNVLLTAMTMSSRVLIAQAAANLKKLMKGEGRTGTSIMAFALEQTAVWSYERVHEATYKPSGDPGSKEPAENDFIFSDLRKRKMTIYLIVPPDYLAEYRSILRVLIGTCMKDLRRSYDTTAKEREPVLLLLDEFPQLGYMQPIEQSLLYIAGYGVRFWFFVQDLSQLQLHYPNSWRTFLANTGTQSFFGVSDIATANLVSEMAGTTTVANKSYGMNTGWNYGESESYSETDSTNWSNSSATSSQWTPGWFWGRYEETGITGTTTQGGGQSITRGTGTNRGVSGGQSEQLAYVGRRLIMPDEVMRMHDEEQIVFMKGLRPIRAAKPPFYINKEMERRKSIKPPFSVTFD